MRRVLFYRVLTTPSYTSDFITATGITDSTIISALTTLEADLTSAGLINYASPSSNKIALLHPFVGGSASTHKYNFLDPRDLNAAFRLVFYGGWTQNATGAKPNGTTGYADTFFSQAAQLSTQDNLFGLYFNTAKSNDLNNENHGAFNLAGNIITEILPQYQGDKTIVANNTSTEMQTIVTDSLGFHAVNRISGKLQFWKKGVKKNETSSLGSTGLVDETLFYGAVQYSNTAYNFATQRIACGVVAKNMSDTDVSNLSTAIEALQVALSRNA